MANYSISDLQQLSGIKAHTIRIWEQRYDALKPGRSEGNTRFYDDTQLRRLLNIVSLVETGMKVNQVCSLPDKKIADLIDEKFLMQKESQTPHEYFISQLIAAGMEFDEILFEKHFSACILRYGLHETYTIILQPMLVRVGLMWNKNSISPAQEHFISNLVRQKLYTAIDALPTPKDTEDSWLLLLPPNEYHEIGLLYANYYIRSHGKKVIYLGAAVPLESMLKALQQMDVKNIYLFFIHVLPHEQIKKLLVEIKKVNSQANLLISGNAKIIDQAELPEKTRILRTVEELEAFIKPVNV
jgi:DNA-binding transcriptional MerR regulator/methylmalonyl-CoA mutase cobalamin-binding subunit